MKKKIETITVSILLNLSALTIKTFAHSLCLYQVFQNSLMKNFDQQNSIQPNNIHTRGPKNKNKHVQYAQSNFISKIPTI